MLPLTRLERQVIAVLMKEKGLSRYDISKCLKGNAGTISRIVGRLVERQYLIEGKEKAAVVGRPRRPLRLNPEAGYIIGLDLEATNVRGAVIDFGLRIINRRRFPLELGCSPATALEVMNKTYKELLKSIEGKRILGVGLGIPGPCNIPEGEIVFYRENLSWSGLPVKKKLERAISQPIFTEHNIFAIAVGENWFQFHGKIENLICMIIRAGVAGVLILNGEIYRGDNDGPGEIAHMKIWPRGESCECGQRGCLCKYVSGRNLMKKMKEMNLAGGEKSVTLLRLAEMAVGGERPAVEIVRKSGRALGIAIGHMVNTLGVGQIIINSDLNRAGRVFLLPIENEVRRVVPRDIHPPQVRFSVLDGYAGALGVAMLALQKVCGIQQIVSPEAGRGFKTGNIR